MALAKIRADSSALRRYLWFQNGGAAILAVPVAADLFRLYREFLEHGPTDVVHLDEEIPRCERRVRTVLCSRRNVVIEPLLHTREGLHASLPFFLLDEEIDALLAALAELLK